MNVPDKGQSPFIDIPDLNISTDGIETKLFSPNPSKACELDVFPSGQLKTVAR